MEIQMLTWHLKITCCWWANVCFIRTILMLCSIAYFFALFTVSCCSDEIFGRPAPNIPGSVRYLAPGPMNDEMQKSDWSWRKFQVTKNIYFYQILSAKCPLKICVNAQYYLNWTDLVYIMSLILFDTSYASLFKTKGINIMKRVKYI